MTPFLKNKLRIHLLTLALLSLLASSVFSASTPVYNLGASLPPHQLIQIVSHNTDTGRSVGTIGDVNNDGVNDMFIGSPNADVPGRAGAGMIYILYGRRNELPVVDLDRFRDDQGYRILGANAGDGIGNIVKNAGDVNNDGFEDLVISVSNYDGPQRTGSGVVYVVFGGQNGLSDIDLSNLDNSQGFRILAGQNDILGDTISSAGDVNGDRIDDILIRIDTSNRNRPQNDASMIYVLYGRRDRNTDINLDNFDNRLGFKIFATDLGPHTDLTVANIGDINRDGLDDIAVGTSNTDVRDRDRPDSVYVIYGRRNGYNDIHLAYINRNQGFKITGASPRDYIGTSISSAGDINHDGINDYLIGAPGAGVPGRNDCGIVYVVYGRQDSDDISLADFSSNQGFKIIGAKTGEKLGTLVNHAGDVNHDGIEDIVITTANPSGISPVMGYIVLGHKGSVPDIDLANDLNPQVVKLQGTDWGARIGKYAGYVGDMNDDGIDDIMVGSNQNAAFVIFGQDCERDLDNTCANSIAPICYVSKGCICTDAGYILQESVCVARVIEATSSNDSKVGVIIGVTVGVVAIVLVIAGIVLYKKRQRAQAAMKNSQQQANAAIYQVEDKITVAPESNNMISLQEGIEYAPKLELPVLPEQIFSLANMADEDRARYEAEAKYG